MRPILLCLAFVLLPCVAAAQDAYVQIEAHPSLATAQGRARDYAATLPDVNGFALRGPWYGVALGPYAPDGAQAALSRFRASGAIPRDSFVVDGASLGDRFWPAGAGAPPSVAAPTAAPAVASAPAEETPTEARSAEAALSQAEREAIQRALQWLGHYDAAIDGAFGGGTRAAMAAWQSASGVEATGILTTAQRASLMSEHAEAQAALGLEPLAVTEAGIALTAPMGLVAFDRIEAPFVHYGPKGGSGVTLSLISQAGDETALAGLYEILQTLDAVPPDGERSRRDGAFAITGAAPDRTTRVEARREGDRIVGFMLSWPEVQDPLVRRALPEMTRSLAVTGPPLPADAGFAASEQSLDTVSGLEVRQPLRSASGFYVDGAGTVATAAATVEGCGRVTLDGRHDATVLTAAREVAVLRPAVPLAPAVVAALAPEPGRLRSPVAVGGFPYGGVLGAASLTFGTLEDVRGLDNEAALLRLSLAARGGDAGGPVLDPAGAVAGMLLPGAAAGGRALPGDAAFALKAGEIEAVLAAAGVVARRAEGGAAVAPEDLVALAEGMTVLVGCWE